jgi:hypothetical protein
MAKSRPAVQVGLDRAFLHVQLPGDPLVGLALAQEIDYRKLTRREVQSVRSPLPFTFRLSSGFAVVECNKFTGIQVPPASISLSAATATSHSTDVGI